ncbi:MAG: hypothetical protein RJA21_299, partial [Gemmatimonadota bacterium]
YVTPVVYTLLDQFQSRKRTAASVTARSRGSMEPLPVGGH